MKLYSTNNPNHIVSLREAVLHSLPPDNGLYVPQQYPALDPAIIENITDYSFRELANIIATQYLREEVPEEIIQEIVYDAINFPAPVINIDDKISILELFHGPTLAFKDFGARFMARLMNHFWSTENKKLNILVATSGDTGGAVAAGFYGLDSIEVTILYPKGKVSRLQESQLTTWGSNIHALEIEGDFDDCQKLVKQAFLDLDLNKHLHLSSANSINIARLIPQSFYYFEAYKQLKKDTPVAFCIPSGNFGNLTAGLIAQRMGLPISHMIAATNINDVFPNYLKTGEYKPTAAIPTLSNAMDIGHPSNFSRIQHMYGSTWNDIKKDISGYSYTDQQTINQILNKHKNNGYVLDPHTAIGVLAAEQYLNSTNTGHQVVVLSTAHPIKFQSEIQAEIDFKIPYPASVHRFLDLESHKTPMSATFQDFKNFLLSKSS
ncbi:threonine synthase [Membranicola marinus]|uniref:Threonine synthase n=1 Tax=Membranihabitans marinus TaxID=1227546 RepID=A0A953HWZ8_9BACT|nr:threonine synthase [Membranihabitans marinus]MBY5958141.1 threonine synthase [Membranihabitans marinus]